MRILPSLWPSAGRNAALKARIDVVAPLLAPGGTGAEIGVHKGHFTRHLLERTRPKRLHLIDPWHLIGPEWHWGDGDRSTIRALQRILDIFASDLTSGKVVLDIGFDLDLIPRFPDAYFDWVYLDSTHEYEQTCRELRALRPKIKAGGVVAGDDWQSDSAHRHHGVCKAVREIVHGSDLELILAGDDHKQWAIRIPAPHQARRPTG